MGVESWVKRNATMPSLFDYHLKVASKQLPMNVLSFIGRTVRQDSKTFSQSSLHSIPAAKVT